MNICCIDYDNVGLHGIKKAFELHKRYSFQDFIIIGKHVSMIRISSGMLQQICNLCYKNMCKIHFHDKDMKNSSDFLLCYYIGLYNTKYREKCYQDASITFHIVSGDTSFTSLEEIDDIVVEIHNIHLPDDVQQEIAKQKEDNKIDNTSSKDDTVIKKNIDKNTFFGFDIVYPVNIKHLVKLLQDKYGKKYHSILGTNKEYSKIKAMKQFIKKSNYLSYEKKSNLVSLIEE